MLRGEDWVVGGALFSARRSVGTIRIDAMPVYRLQRFELRPDERRLQLDGAPVALGARALDVLLALVEQRDRVVTKNELLERAWPGLEVEENNLQVQVSTLRRLLGASAITTVPGRGYRFTLPLTRIEEAPATSPADAAAFPRGNLPRPVGVLHGREADLAAVTLLLASSALVSLVGPGGIGKTRLGLAVADSMPEAPRDGRWLVDLAPIADRDLAVAEVARVLGLPNPKSGAAGVAEALAGQSLLLVLDNCEHLIGAVAPLVDALLHSAPDVRVLVTSQEPLKIEGERVYRLDGLAVPPARTAGNPKDYGAMSLFLERVQSLDPKFPPDAATLAAITEICRHLDGIPLALELAAARVPLLGVEGVLGRLGERFRVLTGGSRFALRRHQTLRATFEFSHALLAEDERAVFRRLSVFTGSFSLEVAQTLCVDDALDAWDALRCLGALVDKSLVIVVGDHPRRLRLLETARAYALEQLGLAGETEHYLERHAEVTADSIRPSLEEGWRLPRAEWVARYERELEDVRAAVGWALAHRPALAIQLIGDAAKLWQEFELWQHALRQCEAARPHLSDATAPCAAGRLWYVEAIANYWNGHGVRTREAGRRAVALLRSTGDLPALAQALQLLAVWSLSPPDEEQWNALAELDTLEPRAGHQRDAPNLHCLRTAARGMLELSRQCFDEACRQLKHARDLYQALGDPAAAARAERMVAVAHLEAGEFDAAIAVLRTVLKPLADMRLRRPYMVGLMELAWCLVEQHNVDAAEAPLREAAPVLVAYGATPHFALMIALYAALCGRLAAAARLVGYRQQHPLSDRTLQPSPVYSRGDAQLRKLLETVPAAQRDAWETEGSTMGERELVAAALDDRVG